MEEKDEDDSKPDKKLNGDEAGMSNQDAPKYSENDSTNQAIKQKFDINKDKSLSMILSIFSKELANSNSLIREAVKVSTKKLG